MDHIVEDCKISTQTIFQPGFDRGLPPGYLNQLTISVFVGLSPNQQSITPAVSFFFTKLWNETVADAYVFLDWNYEQRVDPVTKELLLDAVDNVKVAWNESNATFSSPYEEDYWNDVAMDVDRPGTEPATRRPSPSVTKEEIEPVTRPPSPSVIKDEEREPATKPPSPSLIKVEIEGYEREPATRPPSPSFTKEITGGDREPGTRPPSPSVIKEITGGDREPDTRPPSPSITKEEITGGDDERGKSESGGSAPDKFITGGGSERNRAETGVSPSDTFIQGADDERGRTESGESAHETFIKVGGDRRERTESGKSIDSLHSGRNRGNNPLEFNGRQITIAVASPTLTLTNGTGEATMINRNDWERGSLLHGSRRERESVQNSQAGGLQSVEESRGKRVLIHFRTVSELVLTEPPEVWTWRYDMSFAAYWENRVPMDSQSIGDIRDEMERIAVTTSDEILEALRISSGALFFSMTGIVISKDNDGPGGGGRPDPGEDTSSPTVAPSQTTVESPVESFDLQEWDWQRYVGLALLLSTIVSFATLMILSLVRRRKLERLRRWGYLGSEAGVSLLLSIGWVLKGDRMEIFDKTKTMRQHPMECDDGGSLLLGNFEAPHEVMIGDEIVADIPLESPNERP